MEVTGIRTPGLGDTTYILTHEGHAIVVDPQRDHDRFLAAIEETGAELRYILETHLHNDYISGGPDIARITGAELVLPASAAPAYRHTPAFHMEDIEGERFAIRPIHTPGHTPEHTSYAVIIDGEPTAVFSGGSLLVGSAGRPDLLGPERKETLARLQFISVNRLAAFPDETPLFPTHGEGSFCTAAACGRTTSTIGQEKAENPLLLADGVDEFMGVLYAGLGPWPAYYRHMGPGNTFGWTPSPAELTLPPWSADDIANAEDVTVVDVRSKADFAAGHIPGSVGLELDDQVGVWSGWLLDFESKIVLVADPSQDVEAAVRQFVQIGMDNVAGVMWGVDDWAASGRPLNSYRTVDVAEFTKALTEGAIGPVLDVRLPSEVAEGTIDGAITTYLPDLTQGMPDELNGRKDVWVGCRSGYRASAAAKWLIEAGYEPVVLIGGGIPDVLSRIA